ncbi:MAG: carbohydrate kinase family protein [Ardenticatenaceae bacterium]|nr:carbohydrate kinase family protein [Anaerolineales bacterium]MCB8917368.1 carbohydrate kinase family protein [Ardenticatenaceae bacterium]
MDNHVLVVGGTLLDIKGKPTRGLEPGTSNPGIIRASRGGTARNVAENLSLLGADVVLISAVGDDDTGQKLLRQTAGAGVDISHLQIVPGLSTGTYIALLEQDGSLSVALDDVRAMESITSQYLDHRRTLFRDADIVMIDGSLQPDAMRTAIRLASQYGKPICADPSSARLAHRLLPYLPQLFLVVPNQMEAANLCGLDYPEHDADASQEMARQLVQMGVEIAVVTMTNFGLSYATSDEQGYIPPHYSEMVDSTGTGDALTSAIIFGLINEVPITECMRLGAAAAGLTLQTNETVVPDLSLDMLFDHLTV